MYSLRIIKRSIGHACASILPLNDYPPFSLLPSGCKSKGQEVVKLDSRGAGDTGLERDRKQVTGGSGATGEDAEVGTPRAHRTRLARSRRHVRGPDLDGPKVVGGSLTAAGRAARAECGDIVVEREPVPFSSDAAGFGVSKSAAPAARERAAQPPSSLTYQFRGWL